MTRTFTIAAIGLTCVMLVPSVHAQAPQPQGAAALPTPGSRVLSTVPTPPDGVNAVPAQMSGVPLQVGDLPPGIVAVRVIRTSFESNVANQPVQLRVGNSDRIMAATSGADGRAQFDGLAVGEVVRVRTTLDGEVLESQSFPIPAQGGVRLVLVGGVGAGQAGAETWPTALAAASAAAPSQAAGPQPSPSAPPPTPPTSAYVVFGLVVALVTGAVVLWPRRKVTKVESPPATSRDDVFARLVGVEKDYEAGRLAGDQYLATREALIEELLDIDSSSKTDAA